MMNAIKNHDWKKTLKVILGILLVVFSLAYLADVLSAPKKKLNDIHSRFADTTGSYRIYEADSLNVSVRTREAEIAFADARIIMAGSDSISLSIDLNDSLVRLELMGVVLQQSVIGHFSGGLFFRKILPSAVGGFFSSPFRVTGYSSSIKKHPVIVRKAPRDTLEAARQNHLPDTSNHRPALVILETHEGLTLLLEQSDHRNSAFRLRKFLMVTGYKGRDMIRMTRDLLRLRVPEYHPVIRIRIRRKDLITLYRALPEYPLVAVDPTAWVR